MMFYHVAIYSVNFILALLHEHIVSPLVTALKNQSLLLNYILSPTEHTLDGMNFLNYSSQKRSIIDIIQEVIQS